MKPMDGMEVQLGLSAKKPGIAAGIGINRRIAIGGPGQEDVIVYLVGKQGELTGDVWGREIQADVALPAVFRLKILPWLGSERNSM